MLISVVYIFAFYLRITASHILKSPFPLALTFPLKLISLSVQPRDSLHHHHSRSSNRLPHAVHEWESTVGRTMTADQRLTLFQWCQISAGHHDPDEYVRHLACHCRGERENLKNRWWFVTLFSVLMHSRARNTDRILLFCKWEEDRANFELFSNLKDHFQDMPKFSMWSSRRGRGSFSGIPLIGRHISSIRGRLR